MGAVGLLALGALIGLTLSELGGPRRRIQVSPSGESWLRSLVSPTSVTWYAAAISSPLLAWVVRRFPARRAQWKRSALVHFGVVTVLVSLTTLIFIELLPGELGDLGGTGGFVMRLIAFRMLTEGLPFWALIAVLHALEFYRYARSSEVEAARLTSQLTETRLDALASKLQPHFLFNTLQSISTLLHRARGKYHFVPVEDVQWVEGAQNYLVLHVGARSHMVRGTLTAAAARLDPARFVRVHRSSIVNTSFIESGEPRGHGEFVLHLPGGARVKTSRSYSRTVRGLVEGLE